MHTTTTQDTPAQIAQRVSERTRRGLGSLNSAGFYRNRFPCPKHGGDDANAVLHEHGFIYCHSQCGKIPIPEVMALLGIESAPMTAGQRQTWLETRQEVERREKQAQLERMARNQIEVEVRDNLAHVEDIARYDILFDIEVERLMGLWRQGVLQIDFGQPLSPFPDFSEALPRSLERKQFAALCFAMSERQAALTAYVLQWYADNLIGVYITKPEIEKLARATGIPVSDSTIKRFLKHSIVLEKTSRGEYAMTDRALLVARLNNLVDNMNNKRYFLRRPALFMFGDGLTSGQITEPQFDNAEVWREGDDDKRPSPAPFDAGFTGDHQVELPERLNKSLFAWWWGFNLHEGETISRDAVFQRTGLTAHEQEEARKRLRAVKKQNKTVVEAGTEQDALDAAHIKAAVAYPISANLYAVQGANTYGFDGGPLATLLEETGKTERRSKVSNFDAKKDRESTVQKNDPLPKPKLPTVTKDTPYWDKAFLTRALWNELSDLNLIDPAQFAGKAVTLDDLLDITRTPEAQRAKRERANREK